LIPLHNEFGTNSSTNLHGEIQRLRFYFTYPQKMADPPPNTKFSRCPARGEATYCTPQADAGSKHRKRLIQGNRLQWMFGRLPTNHRNDNGQRTKLQNTLYLRPAFGFTSNAVCKKLTRSKISGTSAACVQANANSIGRNVFTLNFFVS
jgi:hypothetical protein